MTKKDYEKAAALIKSNAIRYSWNAEIRASVVWTFVDFFEGDNYAFDRARFLKACADDVFMSSLLKKDKKGRF